MNIYIPYTNTDLTEGHGYNVHIALCAIKATAKRLAKGRYVQGANGPVDEIKVFEHGGIKYIPLSALYITGPTREDEVNQEKDDRLALAIEMAKKAGLTDEEINTLLQRDNK